MPHYTVVNKKTKKEYIVDLKMAEFDDFLLNNPHIKQVFNKMNIGDPVSLGFTKPPSDFMKGIVGRIQSTVPGAKKDSKFQIPREF